MTDGKWKIEQCSGRPETAKKETNYDICHWANGRGDPPPFKMANVVFFLFFLEPFCIINNMIKSLVDLNYRYHWHYTYAHCFFMPSISPIIDVVSWVGWGRERKRRFMIVNIIGLKRFYPRNPNTRFFLGITIILQSFS